MTQTPPPGPPPGQQPDPTQPFAPVPPPPPTAPPASAAPSAANPPAAPKAPVDRAKLISGLLGVAVLGLTVLANAVKENDQRGYDVYTTWAVFATIMAAAHLVPLLTQLEPRRTWDVVAIATGGLVFYWVAIVLPFIGSGVSFAQTLAVALAVAHCWMLPGRR